jgi:hypothetical protein
MTRPMNDRLAELLVARAVEGLDESEGAELARWLAEAGVADDPSLEQAASAVQVAYTPMLKMPGELTSKMAAAADRFAQGLPEVSVAAAPALRLVPRAVDDLPTEIQPLPRVAARRTWVPWLAAAACLVLAGFGWLCGAARFADGAAKSAADMREALLKEKGTLVLPWSATKEPAASGAAGDVTGDLVWSEADQKGYMRFHGLAANDRSREEYQLWIFDSQQDERFPVDGGVFDVDRSTGDVVVPIVAKLHVAEPTLFAVTVEKPGGVVVSKRERIVVTAAPKA